MKTSFAAAILLCMACSPFASAKENYHEKAFNADTKDKFAATADQVRDELGHGGRYEFVPAKERAKIDASLADMGGLFDRYGSVAAMTQDAKVRLFNDQEIVNSILTHRDRDRVICKHEAPLGSHIPVTTCHTYGQEVEAREGTQQILDTWKQAPCAATPSGPGQVPSQCYMGSGAGGGH